MYASHIRTVHWLEKVGELRVNIVALLRLQLQHRQQKLLQLQHLHRQLQHLHRQEEALIAAFTRVVKLVPMVAHGVERLRRVHHSPYKNFELLYAIIISNL